MKKFLVLVLGLFFVFSCEKKPTQPLHDPSIHDEITPKTLCGFYDANMVFSHNIYKEILSESEEDGNIMISPLSISIALSMLNNGAAGNTKDEIKDVLELSDFSDYCINRNFRDLREELDHYSSVVDLDLANSAWFDDGFPVKQEFIDVNREYYGADIRNLDLDITASIDTINAWVSDKTDGKIEDVLSYEDIFAEFFLINAINFQGFWKCPFDSDVTENDRFYSEDGTYSVVPTMMANIESEWYSGEPSAIRQFSFLYRDNFKAVKMPYGKENAGALTTKASGVPVNMDNINMYIFVPQGDLKSFLISELNGDNWNDWTGSFEKFDDLYPEGISDFMFTMPKFKFGFDINLIPILQNLGMTDAFNGGAANLSGITDMWQGLFIGLVKHKSFIEVNEEGTSAAAVTVIGGNYGPPPQEFRVNKPFFFAIRDDLTGTILFMGQVYSPSAE